MGATQIIVYGAGGQGACVAWTALSSRDTRTGRNYEVVCFIDDDPALQGQDAHGLPVMDLKEARATFPAAEIVGSIGSPRARKLTMAKAAAEGFRFGTIVHPSCILAPTVDLGSGVVMEPGSTVAPYARLGRHVMVLIGCIVGHHVVIGDHSILMAGSRIAGHVVLGEGVVVGMGATIINGSPDQPIVIGDHATIGAGACVTKSVPPDMTVVGVPAGPIRRANPLSATRRS